MSSNAKSTRDRAPKCSIVLNNVLAVVFRPTSTAVQIDEVAENTEKPPHQMTGSELFDAFRESNRSTMLTRLNESLDEIRLKGWIFPFTLLIKGPHEDVEVVKEAWRRHFLRSPDGFIIRDIGAVSSIGMEVIQQAPFLPLTKSLVETIAALNGSKLAATQQSITEYLAKTYQYVHVPKLHVIHDCLGILIKERKIYHTGNGYFVSKRNTVEKSTDAPKENGDAKEPRCVACEGNSKGKAGKTENGKKRNRVKEKESGKEKGKGKNRSSTREEESSEPKASIEKAEKGNTEERKRSKSETQPKKEEQCKVPSETASVSSGEGTNKKTKKQKKSGVLNQISCFIKGRTFSTTEIPEGTKHEQTQTASYLPSPPANNTADQRNAPLAEPEVESPTLLRNERSVHFRQNRTLSAPAGNRYMQENETRIAPVELRTKNVKTEPSNYQELVSSVTRSRSFVASAGKRPKPVARSNSFTAPSGRTARPLSTDMATGTWETRLRLNYGDIIRNAPARRTIHVSRPSSCNIGIVRPLDTSHQRPLSRSNSVKREAPRKKGGSLSPSSTPRLREKAVDHRDLTVVRSKSFTEPTSFRSSPNRYDSRRATIGPYYHNSPVQPLVKKSAPHVSPLSPKVRITVPSKGKARAPVKHLPPAPKKTSPKSPTQKQQKKPAGLPAAPAKREVPQPVPQPRNDNCSSPICYDKSMVNVKVDNCKCNFGVNNDEVKYNRYLHADYRGANQKYPCLPSNGVSSEQIFLEELTSTASSASSEVTLNEEEAYEQTAETKPLGMYQKINGEGVNDSLTFIGII